MAMAQRMYKLAWRIPRSIITSGSKAARSDPYFVTTQRMTLSKMSGEIRTFAKNKPFSHLMGKICLGVGVATAAGGLAMSMEVVDTSEAN